MDADEAVQFYRENSELTDAAKAYIVAVISNDGYSNKKIRDTLCIAKTYTVTHLKRAGSSLSDAELSLWHNNPKRITLGHVRAIAKLSIPQREPLLRQLLTTKMSVRKFELLGKGKEVEPDTDTKRYADEMGKVLGRTIKIKYDPSKKTGSITLDFYRLTDLQDMAFDLGFKPDELF